MSTIPQAQSQISEKPAPNAVTHAMDAKQKAADVDRKMRFYGVIQAFREGRYPDNKQIDVSVLSTSGGPYAKSLGVYVDVGCADADCIGIVLLVSSFRMH